MNRDGRESRGGQGNPVEDPAPDDSPDGAGPSAKDAFRLLSDELRLGILRTLWAADGETVPYSTIRAALDDPDSGRFNYHLGELEGHFVVAGDAGYRLAQPGREVVRAVLAGTLTAAPRTDPTTIDGDCPDCGGPLAFRYEEYGRVDCTDCETTIMWNEFPPAGLADRSGDAAAAAFDRWTRSRFRLAATGVCPNCAARTTTDLPPDAAGTDGDLLATLHRCRNCRYEARVPLFGHVMTHPAVVSFFHDRGVDVTAMSYWQLRTLAASFEVAVVAEDPWEARVRIHEGEATLTLALDADLDAIEVPPDGVDESPS